MDIYKPISREEIIKALVLKFGGVETVRYFLSDALSDLQTMEVGVGDNNPLQATKALSSLRDNLQNIRTMLENKDYKPSIEKAIKDSVEKV